MKHIIDYSGLGALVRGHRLSKGMNLRNASKEAGVSASTISRVENGEGRPDIETVQALVDWVGVPIERVVTTHSRPPKPKEQPYLDEMEIQFRADPNLSPQAAEALISIMKTAYTQFIGSEKGKE